jgi:hypothetical protein
VRGRPILFSGFVGGINQRDAPYLLADNEARDARNVQGTVRGAIRKRDGANQFSTPGAALHSLFAAQTPTVLVGIGGTTLYSIAPNGTVTSRGSSASYSSLIEWVQAPVSGGQGPLYGANGVAAIYWDGSAASAGGWTASTGTLPIGKYLVYAGNRIWAAGMSSYGSLADPGSAVVFSELGDPRNWPAANVVLFDPNDGEAISGIGRVGPFMLVFKPSKCWVIYDLDTGANRPLAQNIGCVANRSIIESDEGTFFLSRDQGVFKTNGSNLERLNDKIQPTFDAILQVNRQLASGVVFDGHYYLAVSTSGSANNLLLDYDLRLGSWWIHSLPVSDLTIWEPAGSPQLHASVAGVARTDQLFVPGRTLDAGDVVYSGGTYWRGAHHVFGAPQIRKRARALHFDGKGVIEVSIAKDFARTFVDRGQADFTGNEGDFGVSDGSLFGVGNGTIYGGASDVQEQKFATLGVARAWSVEFGNTTSDEMEVESYTFMIEPRRD